jgi:Zn-dependent peptidase ImmA (M78 family)
MKWVRDRTGRFAQRPHYMPEELDAACEAMVNEFLTERLGEVRYPIETNDLVVLVERETADFDMFAAFDDDDVEGVTYFCPGGKPDVHIAARLASEPWSGNRFRTTVTHELGHVAFHNVLWPAEAPLMLFDDAEVGSSPGGPQTGPKCRRQSMLEAPPVDWMEWQAGYACGAFLMPLSALRATVRPLLDGAGHHGPVALDTHLSRELVAAVRDGFEVSAEAARVRLERLHHLVAPSAATNTADLFG